MSTSTNDLVKLGMIERCRGTADRRTVELTLTTTGRKSLAQWQITNEELISVALTSLIADDRTRIERALFAAPTRRAI